MDSQILKDWTDFCEGRRDFDKSHFYTLFVEQQDPEFFETALKYFPSSSELLRRIAKIVGFGDPEALVVKVRSPEDALKFAAMDVQERVKIAGKYNEPDLVEELSNLKARFCEDFEEVHQAGFNDLQAWQLETIGDWFLDHLSQKDHKIYALLEAFYGLTTSLELKWFLGSPLINEDLNLDNYVELWKAGADYAVKDGELLVGARNLSFIEF